MSIAGHIFSNPNGTCSCGKRFADIANVRPEDVGKEGWAHSGCLTQHEHDQIIAERDRIWSLVVAGANGGDATTHTQEQP